MCALVGPAPGRCGLPRAHTQPTSLQQKANRSRVNVLYSTPACYLWELNKANLTWYLGVPGSWGGVGLPCVS